MGLTIKDTVMGLAGLLSDDVILTKRKGGHSLEEAMRMVAKKYDIPAGVVKQLHYTHLLLKNPENDMPDMAVIRQSLTGKGIKQKARQDPLREIAEYLSSFGDSPNIESYQEDFIRIRALMSVSMDIRRLTDAAEEIDRKLGEVIRDGAVRISGFRG
jgi:ABC-type proline/glycine betaine transport system ATPase subunit